MELDITRTHTLLAAFENTEPAPSFLKDRYFPTDDTIDVFNTDDVLVDYQDASGDTVAPFVIPGGSTDVARDGFHTSRFTPPLIAPKRKMTIDDLKKRGFGESVFSDLTPAERELTLTLKDLKDLEKTTIRREELMAAETFMTDGCVMTPEGGAANVIKFHTGDVNPYQYAPATAWSDAGAKIYDDICAMVQMLTSRALPAKDLLVSPDVANMILHNTEMQKLLDISRLNVGNIHPLDLDDAAAHIGTINAMGKMINIISYAGMYKTEAGELTHYLPEGTAIVTAPGAGRGLYGCITQLEQADNQFHSYKGRRVPKYIADPTTNERTVTLSSAPILIPKVEGGWIFANVGATI